jgi:hypothetical protein
MRHGWFQTVVSDLPHFTFIGRDERVLPQFGLRRVSQTHKDQEYVYWVPEGVGYSFESRRNERTS